MICIRIIYIFLYMRLIYSYINDFLLNNIKARNIRKNINLQINENYKSLSYVKAKKILHTELNNIDIYGDNENDKNVEHVFPQCYFKNRDDNLILKSDLHNLYLCNTKLNSQRQNFKYITHEDYIDNVNDHYLDQKGNNLHGKDIFKKQGYMMIMNKKNKKFIPTMYSRGMISRSLAYFSIKYNLLDELKNVIDIKTLIEWNLKDPPCDLEYHKNIICYKYQKNVNPFIIDSDLMIYAFSDIYKVDDVILQKKKTAIINPLYSIDVLLKDIDVLENENKKLLRRNNLLTNNLKK